MKRKMQHLAAAVMVALPCVSFAALGERADTVNSDQIKMRAAARPAIAHASFSVHEFVTPAGTAVREFTTSDGTIFGVAWEGPSLPDVHSLLGKYFGQYQAATRANPASQRHAAVKTNDLVVESAGRLRAFHGRAYIPQLLPTGVSPNQVQ